MCASIGLVLIETVRFFFLVYFVYFCLFFFCVRGTFFFFSFDVAGKGGAAGPTLYPAARPVYDFVSAIPP